MGYQYANLYTVLLDAHPNELKHIFDFPYGENNKFGLIMPKLPNTNFFSQISTKINSSIDQFYIWQRKKSNDVLLLAKINP